MTIARTLLVLVFAISVFLFKYAGVIISSTFYEDRMFIEHLIVYMVWLMPYTSLSALTLWLLSFFSFSVGYSGGIQIKSYTRSGKFFLWVTGIKDPSKISQTSLCPIFWITVCRIFAGTFMAIGFSGAVYGLFTIPYAQGFAWILGHKLAIFIVIVSLVALFFLVLTLTKPAIKAKNKLTASLPSMSFKTKSALKWVFIVCLGCVAVVGLVYAFIVYTATAIKWSMIVLTIAIAILSLWGLKKLFNFVLQTSFGVSAKEFYQANLCPRIQIN